MYSKYDKECMMYLSIQIIRSLIAKDKYIVIDLFTDLIEDIYEDYKKYDNPKKSLLDSVNDYITTNEDDIKQMIYERGVI